MFRDGNICEPMPTSHCREEEGSVQHSHVGDGLSSSSFQDRAEQMHLNPKCQTDTALGCQVILVGCMEICD